MILYVLDDSNNLKVDRSVSSKVAIKELEATSKWAMVERSGYSAIRTVLITDNESSIAWF